MKTRKKLKDLVGDQLVTAVFTTSQELILNFTTGYCVLEAGTCYDETYLNESFDPIESYGSFAVKAGIMTEEQHKENERRNEEKRRQFKELRERGTLAVLKAKYENETQP
jgi:hypothetical protein